MRRRCQGAKIGRSGYGVEAPTTGLLALTRPRRLRVPPGITGNRSDRHLVHRKTPQHEAVLAPAGGLPRARPRDLLPRTPTTRPQRPRRSAPAVRSARPASSTPSRCREKEGVWGGATEKERRRIIRQRRRDVLTEPVDDVDRPTTGGPMGLDEAGGWPGVLGTLESRATTSPPTQARAAMAEILAGAATAGPDRRVHRRPAHEGRDGRRAARAWSTPCSAPPSASTARRRRAGRRHRRHRRRPRPHHQRVDPVGAGRGRRRRPGVQARQPGGLVVVAARPTCSRRSASRIELRTRRRGPLRGRGRHRLLLRPAVPPRHAPRRPDRGASSASRRRSTSSGRWPTRPACAA